MSTIKRIIGGAALSTTLLAAAPAIADAEVEMTVYKTPWCGCCTAWVDHVRAGGVDVRVVELDDLQPMKMLAGVPGQAQSCHTAMIGDYVVEGHVPMHVVQRLLEERPAIDGIAVPGMPIGSPGMEGPNPEPYDVLTLSDGEIGPVYEHIAPE